MRYANEPQGLVATRKFLGAARKGKCGAPALFESRPEEFWW